MEPVAISSLKGRPATPPAPAQPKVSRAKAKLLKEIAGYDYYGAVVDKFASNDWIVSRPPRGGPVDLIATKEIVRGVKKNTITKRYLHVKIFAKDAPQTGVNDFVQNAMTNLADPIVAVVSLAKNKDDGTLRASIAFHDANTRRSVKITQSERAAAPIEEAAPVDAKPRVRVVRPKKEKVVVAAAESDALFASNPIDDDVWG